MFELDLTCDDLDAIEAPMTDYEAGMVIGASFMAAAAVTAIVLLT